MQALVKAMVRNQFVLLILGFLIGFAACFALLNHTGDKTIAVVNGESIKQSEVNQVMEAKSGSSVLGRLVDNKVVENAAKASGISVSTEELDKELKLKIDMEYHSQSAFNDSLSSLDMTLDEAKEELRLAMLFDRIATKDIKISDEDVQKYFKDNTAKFVRPEMRKVREIVLKEEADANTVREQLLKGADFASLAQEKSIGVDKEKGGDRGLVVQGTLNPVTPEVEKVVFQVKEGEISQVIKSPDGFHIVKVEQVIPRFEPAFQDIKDSVAIKAKLEKSRPFTEILDNLRKAANIQIKDSKYGAQQ